MKLWTIAVAVLMYVSVAGVQAAEPYEEYPKEKPSFMGPRSSLTVPPGGTKVVLYNPANPPAWLEGSTEEEKTLSFEKVLFEVLTKIENDAGSDVMFTYARTSAPCSHTQAVNVFMICWVESVNSNDGVTPMLNGKIEFDRIILTRGTVLLSKSYQDVEGFDKYLRMRLFRGTLALLAFPAVPNGFSLMGGDYPDLTDWDRQVLGYLLPARDASCPALEAGRRESGRLFVTVPYVWVNGTMYTGTFEQQADGLFTVVGMQLADKLARTCALAFDVPTQTLDLPDVVYQLPNGQINSYEVRFTHLGGLKFTVNATLK